MFTTTRPRLLLATGLFLLPLVFLAALSGGLAGVVWLLGTLITLAVVGGVYVLVSGRHMVPTGYIGVVHLRFGPTHPEDRFTVRIHGSPGPQAAVLEANRLYWLPPPLYSVDYVPRVYVPRGTIGVVVAKAGAPPAINQTLSRHVECDYFQDGRAFLAGGGQMGRQPGILPGGATYAINPALFEVLTVDTIGGRRHHDLTADDLRDVPVPEGSTGVVIALEGEAPDEADGAVGRRVAGHMNFQLPWVFLANGGQRGAQAETLSHGGVYRINPWFARIVLIPTRALSLNWTKRDAKPVGSYDTALDRIRINVEGYWLRFGMSQTIRIPAKAAPLLVGRFGEQETDAYGPSDAANPTPVQRFVERVLGDTVAGYFQATASEYKVLNFIASRNEVRIQLEDQVRQALAEWGVEAIRTNLSEFEPEDATLDELRREIATERERLQRQIAAENERHQVLREREKNVALEELIKQTQLKTEKERRKLEVATLEERIRVLGPTIVAMEIVLDKLRHMKVPAVVSGDTDFSRLMPLVIGKEVINKLLDGNWSEADVTALQQRMMDIPDAVLSEPYHDDRPGPVPHPPDGTDAARISRRRAL